MKAIGHKTKLSKIMIILGIILVIELIFFLLYSLFFKNKDCYSLLDKEYNDVIPINDGYIVVGNNNYYDTDDAKYNGDKILNQGEITKIDKELNIVWATSYYLNGDVNLIGINEIKDGYIIIGNEIKELEHDNDSTGIILKVDKEGKIIKSVTYDLLDNTKFTKIIRDNDKNIVIGYSQYELDKIGNHLGGGIILKVDDNLNIVEQNNYGGNKSGEFNNIFVLKDSYLVTGLDAGYPVIIKYNKNFNREKDDKELISKKIIYNKTLDREMEFNPIYYYDNKLYDGKNIYDLSNNSFKNISNELDGKGILLIKDNYIYVIDKKLKKYDMDHKLIEEIEVDELITKLIPIKNNFIYIKTECIKCECNSEIKMLIRQ